MNYCKLNNFNNSVIPSKFAFTKKGIKKSIQQSCKVKNLLTTRGMVLFLNTWVRDHARWIEDDRRGWTRPVRSLTSHFCSKGC
jgi:hypothetical protein